MIAKHKEDEHEVYDPWGRPGAGAPIRTQSGNVVADYKKMHQVNWIAAKQLPECACIHNVMDVLQVTHT